MNKTTSEEFRWGAAIRSVALGLVTTAALLGAVGCGSKGSTSGDRDTKRDAKATSDDDAPKRSKSKRSDGSGDNRGADRDGDEPASDDKDETPSDAKADPSPTPSDGPDSPAGGDAPKAVSAECTAACEHRKACSITEDAARCGADCQSIRPAFEGTLADYASGDCSRVQAEEPLYQNAIRCAKGCDRRVTCMSVSDRDRCVADCSVAGLKPEHLDEYAAQTCEKITEQEPAHQELRQMIHTCKRLLDCNVKGTLQGCLQLAKSNLEDGVYKVDKLVSLEKESCDVLQKTAYIEPPPRAGGGASGGSGASSGGGWAPGWFGSWTDTHGVKVYHRPPGPGVF